MPAAILRARKMDCVDKIGREGVNFDHNRNFHCSQQERDTMKKMISILSLMLMMAMSRGFAADACGDAPKGADDKAVESKAK